VTASALASRKLARSLELDPAYLRQIVEELSSVGSSPLGFRATGTPEDREVAGIVERELLEIGLHDVAIEPVRVDGWRFRHASLAVVAGEQYVAASMGGVPPTPEGGVTAPLVDAGTGERRRLDRMNVRGCVVLVDWVSAGVSPSEIGLELGLRGAAGMVLSCPHGGPHYQSPGALGSFDSHWHREAPPMITMRREDVSDLRLALTAGPFDVRLTLAADLDLGADGHNVVGYLPGEDPDAAPLVVGAHHDGWFRAAFDNASGVATLLGLARAFAASGERFRHPICFTSRTAEEYGVHGAFFDWCTGAWEQVSRTHAQWGAASPFHLCLEATGHPSLRLILEAPSELTRFARAAGRLGKTEGWLTSGWRVGPPVTGTEQWPYLLAGVPGIAAYTWETSFARTDYHTPLDTIELLDFEHMARLARLYALVLLEADRDPDGILDHPARATDVAKAAERLGERGAGLREAAALHAQAQGRRAFTRIGRKLLALDATAGPAYPHEQAAKDLAGLEQGLDALAQGDLQAAARHLSDVGDNALARRLSERAFALRRARLHPHSSELGWGRRSHLTASPNLWRELASLRREPLSRAPGPWLERSLRRHLEATRADLDRRIAMMERALRGDAGRAPRGLGSVARRSLAPPRLALPVPAPEDEPALDEDPAAVAVLDEDPGAGDEPLELADEPAAEDAAAGDD
jgi:peptidase M28-like protein